MQCIELLDRRTDFSLNIVVDRRGARRLTMEVDIERIASNTVFPKNVVVELEPTEREEIQYDALWKRRVRGLVVNERVVADIDLAIRVHKSGGCVPRTV